MRFVIAHMLRGLETVGHCVIYFIIIFLRAGEKKKFIPSKPQKLLGKLKKGQRSEQDKEHMS